MLSRETKATLTIMIPVYIPPLRPLRLVSHHCPSAQRKAFREPWTTQDDRKYSPESPTYYY